MRLTAEQIAVLVPADGKFHSSAFSNGRDIDFSIHNRPLSEDELKALSLDVAEIQIIRGLQQRLRSTTTFKDCL